MDTNPSRQLNVESRDVAKDPWIDRGITSVTPAKYCDSLIAIGINISTVAP